MFDRTPGLKKPFGFFIFSAGNALLGLVSRVFLPAMLVWGRLMSTFGSDLKWDKPANRALMFVVPVVSLLATGCMGRSGFDRALDEVCEGPECLEADQNNNSGGAFTPADPCIGIACSGHGECTSLGSTVRCECETGYTPEALQCVLDGCVARPDQNQLLCDGGDVFVFDECGRRVERSQECGIAGCVSSSCDVANVPDVRATGTELLQWSSYSGGGLVPTEGTLVDTKSLAVVGESVYIAAHVSGSDEIVVYQRSPDRNLQRHSFIAGTGDVHQLSLKADAQSDILFLAWLTDSRAGGNLRLSRFEESQWQPVEGTATSQSIAEGVAVFDFATSRTSDGLRLIAGWITQSGEVWNQNLSGSGEPGPTQIADGATTSTVQLAITGFDDAAIAWHDNTSGGLQFATTAAEDEWATVAPVANQGLSRGFDLYYDSEGRVVAAYVRDTVLSTLRLNDGATQEFSLDRSFSDVAVREREGALHLFVLGRSGFGLFTVEAEELEPLQLIAGDPTSDDGLFDTDSAIPLFDSQARAPELVATTNGWVIGWLASEVYAAELNEDGVRSLTPETMIASIDSREFVRTEPNDIDVRALELHAVDGSLVVGAQRPGRMDYVSYQPQPQEPWSGLYEVTGDAEITVLIPGMAEPGILFQPRVGRDREPGAELRSFDESSNTWSTRSFLSLVTRAWAITNENGTSLFAGLGSYDEYDDFIANTGSVQWIIDDDLVVRETRSIAPPTIACAGGRIDRSESFFLAPSGSGAELWRSDPDQNSRIATLPFRVSSCELEVANDDAIWFLSRTNSSYALWRFDQEAELIYDATDGWRSPTLALSPSGIPVLAWGLSDGEWLQIFAAYWRDGELRDWQTSSSGHGLSRSASNSLSPEVAFVGSYPCVGWVERGRRAVEPQIHCLPPID